MALAGKMSYSVWLSSYMDEIKERTLNIPVNLTYAQRLSCVKMRVKELDSFSGLCVSAFLSDHSNYMKYDS